MKIFGWLFLLAYFFNGASAHAADSSVGEHKLANGMRVIVKTDRRAPVVVSRVWDKVGSVDEVNGMTGVAHVLEHMLFKGTKLNPKADFSKIVAAARPSEPAAPVLSAAQANAAAAQAFAERRRANGLAA